MNKISDINDSEFEIFNQDNLNEFDQEDQKELINIFLQSSFKNIKKLKESSEKNDLKEILFHIHTLKGSSGVIGAERLFNYAKNVEIILKNNKDLPDGWLKELETIYNQSIAEVKNVLEKF